MRDTPLSKVLLYLEQRHPRSLTGVAEARAVSPERFEALANQFLGWLLLDKGEKGLRDAVDAFVQFTTDVNLAQARYEEEGSYPCRSFAEAQATHYGLNEVMTGYLLGIYLSNFLWAHHAKLSFFYEDYFLRELPSRCSLIEIAPGHGGWGLWALSRLEGACLKGFDISRASLEMATGLSRVAGLSERAKYFEQDGLELASSSNDGADAVVCNFLLEHLERPEKLFSVIHGLLKPGGLCFVSGALTAAQMDHIHEFQRESELVLLSERHGLRVLATLCASPERTLPGARFLPRSMGLVVEKREGELV